MSPRTAPAHTKLPAALAFCLLVLPLWSQALTIEPRSSWNAAAPTTSGSIRGPVEFVIIHHTDSPGACTTEQQCKRSIKSIQNYHMGTRKFGDIGYNFIVTGDGKVYEGRGFGRRGAHSPNYNSKSIGIVFMGNYESSRPTAQMLQNAKELIAKAKADGHLKENYTLLGHRQTRSTSCPGTALYNEIKTWPKWRNI